MTREGTQNTEEHQVRKVQEANSEATFRFVRGLTRESERSLVILGAAQLDVVLERLLRNVLQPQPGSDDKLFGPDRPLGSTYAKINFAYRLGIIDADVERALQLVRRIRNDFAHSIEEATLSAGPHRDRLNELVKLCERNSAYSELHDGVSKRNPGTISDPVVDFAVVMCILLMSLAGVAAISQRVKPSHRAMVGW